MKEWEIGFRVVRSYDAHTPLIRIPIEKTCAFGKTSEEAWKNALDGMEVPADERDQFVLEWVELKERHGGLQFSYEPPPIDILTIEGVKYSGSLFKMLGVAGFETGTTFKIWRTRDNVLTIGRIRCPTIAELITPEGARTALRTLHDNGLWRLFPDRMMEALRNRASGELQENEI